MIGKRSTKPGKIPGELERRDDILPLARHFLVKFSRDFGKEYSGVSPEAASALKAYDWRGNARELKSLIERGVLAGKGKELALQDLGMGSSGKEPLLEQERYEPGVIPIPPEGIDFSFVRESFEKAYIQQALKLAEGNETRAAKLLNMNHHTFRYRRKRLRIP